MSGRLLRFVVEELMRPVVLLGRVISAVYSLAFGRADELESRKRDHDFAAEISANVPVLSEKNGATAVPDPQAKYPRPFDYVVAIIQVNGVLFRFTRGRSELRIQVAPGGTEEWHELSWLLTLLAVPEWEATKPFCSLEDVAGVLEKSMDLIKEAFSSRLRVDTVRKLSEFRQYERVVAKQLETEINRRLYPD